MTKTELKQNITKINKLLRSDSYEAGIELIKTLDDPEISKGTAKTIMVKIKKLLTQYDYDSIDQGTGIVQLLSDRINFLSNSPSITFLPPSTNVSAEIKLNVSKSLMDLRTVFPLREQF